MRDGYECVVPGCAMRKMLDPHHLEFRSQGWDHDPSNVVSICRVHHALLHRGICELTGRVGVDLTFERPRLFTEKKTAVATKLRDEPAVAAEEPPSPEPEEDDSEDWREETVAAIFDGPPPSTRSAYDGLHDPLLEFGQRHRPRAREAGISPEAVVE